jgi:SecD/SecF fusion protein
MGRSRILRSPAMLGAGEQRLRWNFDFIGKSRYFFAMSGVILTIGSVAVATKGLNFGIDFRSGTRVTSDLVKPASVEDVRSAISPLGLKDAKIQQVKNKDLGPHAIQVSTSELGPGGVKRLEDTLRSKFGVTSAGFSSESVGPTFGKTVARSATIAIIASLFLIMAYVAFRFDPKFAVPVLIALFHDILITAGVYALTGREVTTSTVAALLTILGFSLYDTVIVFDRVRENAPRMPRAAFSQIVNRSMSEVLTRSLATSFCTLLPVTSLLLFGGETLKDFAFALLVGIASGAYSSIFIASPVLTEWKEREPGYVQRRHRILEQFGHVPAFAVVTREGAPATAGPAEAEREPVSARAAVEPDGRDGRRRRRPEPEPVANGEAEYDGDAEELEIEDSQEAATVPGGTMSPEPEARQRAVDAVRAERAERKKRARQRSRRKHGRRR